MARRRTGLRGTSEEHTRLAVKFAEDVGGDIDRVRLNIQRKKCVHAGSALTRGYQNLGAALAHYEQSGKAYAATSPVADAHRHLDDAKFAFYTACTKGGRRKKRFI